jgi:hypothetical protein
VWIDRFGGSPPNRNSIEAPMDSRKCEAYAMPMSLALRVVLWCSVGCPVIQWRALPRQVDHRQQPGKPLSVLKHGSPIKTTTLPNSDHASERWGIKLNDPPEIRASGPYKHAFHGTGSCFWVDRLRSCASAAPCPSRSALPEPLRRNALTSAWTGVCLSPPPHAGAKDQS